MIRVLFFQPSSWHPMVGVVVRKGSSGGCWTQQGPQMVCVCGNLGVPLWQSERMPSLNNSQMHR